jgi:hypothetical protein
MLICFVFILLTVIANAKLLRYKEIESDIRIGNSLYNELYKKDYTGPRILGSIDDTGDGMKIWRNNYTNSQFIVPVTLLEDDDDEGTNSLTEQTSSDIFSALVSMADKLGNVIKFIRYDGIDPKPDYYIKIGNFGGGCWSYVGRIPLEYQPQAMNIGFGCLFTDTIEHEMMHALGFFHEHARPDRDEHVNIHWDNIDSEKYFNFNIMTEINSRGTPYDYESIMHYTSTAFALDPQYPTISLVDSESTVVLGSSMSMTDIDQHQIRLLYRCESSVMNVDGNCSPSCPCRLNEGNCTVSTQCSGTLSCYDNTCVYNNSTTVAPTTVPTVPTPVPTVSTPVPTSVPTPEITNGTIPDEKNSNMVMIALGVGVIIFALILVVNVI